jgi:hypothetical protein
MWLSRPSYLAIDVTPPLNLKTQRSVSAQMMLGDPIP